ncbi:MAG: glycyl-radical enzyme activating protein [Erysipelotrichaceae bacterium]|nr:glycyl-radical enzyme activating protein [Erysipelotrichaceae bacterium]
MIDNNQGKIFNIQKFSLHDGPGIRTVVFLKGCPLGCKWCSNPESQNKNIQIIWEDKEISCIEVKDFDNLNIDKEGNIKVDEDFIKKYNLDNERLKIKYKQEGRIDTVDNIVDVCMQDNMFYLESGGGVTLSGGEILLQSDFSISLLKKLKENNIHTAIETTGFSSYEILKSVSKYVDLVLYDLKHWDEEFHKKYTLVSNKQIISNLKRLFEDNVNILVRIPVIPGVNDSLHDAQKFSHLLNNIGINEVQLLPFHKLGEVKYENLNLINEFKNEKALYPEDLKDYQNIFINNNINCYF